MKGLILASVFLGCLLLVQGYVDEDKVERALEALFKRAYGNEKRGGPFDCNPLGDDCTGVVPCCGSLQCYWKDGYNTLKEGECVKCVQQDQKCQRDSQCCGHFQCDKGNALWMDGTCQKFRRSGKCYRDGQCVNDCKKKWYETSGECE